MTILVAYDGSSPAQAAVRQALEDHPDDEIVILRVIEAAEGSTGAGVELLKELFTERRAQVTDESRDELAAIIDEHGARITFETAVGNPSREIVRYATATDVDHVYVGNHGRSGISRVLLGSVAERVVRRAPVPVTVVR